MEWIALVIAFIVAGFAFAMVFGKASRLGHGDERESPRKPLDMDTDFL
jgi:hypothetical protein